MNRRISLAAAAAVAALCASAPARAQSTVSITARGSAVAADASTGRDQRQVAIDRAFADAVSQQVTRELTTTERRKARDGIERDIVRRARLYIRSYKVTGEDTAEGRMVVTVSAVVDRDKLVSALGKLGVSVSDTGARRAPTPSSDGRPTVALILHASRGNTIDTTFGARGGPGGPAGQALAAQLDALGFGLAATAGASPSTSTDAAEHLPVGDSSALELARSIGAGAAVVVGIDVNGDGRIRATSLFGAAGRATVRVLDVATGKALVSGGLDAAAVGASEQAAMDSAASTLGRLVGERAGSAMSRRWPTAIPSSGRGRLVVVRGAARWASVEAIAKRLRAIPGARTVTPRRLAAGTVGLEVDTSLGVDELARQLSHMALPLGTATARAAGDRVDVEVDGDEEGRD